MKNILLLFQFITLSILGFSQVKTHSYSACIFKLDEIYESTEFSSGCKDGSKLMAYRVNDGGTINIYSLTSVSENTLPLDQFFKDISCSNGNENNYTDTACENSNIFKSQGFECRSATFKFSQGNGFQYFTEYIYVFVFNGKYLGVEISMNDEYPIDKAIISKFWKDFTIDKSKFN